MEPIEAGAAEKARELEELNDRELQAPKKLSSNTIRALSSAIPGFNANLPEEEVEEPEEATNEEEQEEPEQVDDIEAEQETEEQEEPEEPEEPQASFVNDLLIEALGEEAVTEGVSEQEALSNVLNDYKALKLEQETYQSLTELFDQSDDMIEVARLMNQDGYSFGEALASVIDFEDWQKELEETDPVEYKKVLRRQFEREQRIAQEKKAAEDRQKAFEENEKASVENLNAFVSENKLDDSQSKEFQKTLGDFFKRVASGLLTQADYELFYNGLFHKDEVQKVKEKVSLDAKNKAIEEVTNAKNKKNGDGTPAFRSRNALKTNEPISRGKKAVVDAVTRRKHPDWR